MNVRCLSFILLLLCCAAPLASAGGMAKIYVSPAEASWKTGQTVQVKVMYDNNLNPVARDISLYFDWNAEMLKYESCDFKVGNSVQAGLLSSHELNMMVGDFTTGYPKGEYPLAILTFRVIGPGDTPLLIRVARLNDMDNKPATFVTGKGMYSIAGDAVAPGTAATPRPTTQIPAGVIVVTPATTYTPIPTIPLATVTQAGVLPPVVVATTLPPVQPAQVGGVPNWPVLTPGATIATPYPTTIETTVPTTVPTTVETTVPTTVPTTWPTTTPPTTVPTTARQITLPTAEAVAFVPVGIPVNDTPTVNETVTPARTLPSPLANSSNVTAEPTAEWPLDGNATAEPTLFIVRGTTASVTKAPVVNNSSAALAPVAGTGGSILGDAWLLVLAAVAGVGLVTVGIVAMRRKRDDWL